VANEHRIGHLQSIFTKKMKMKIITTILLVLSIMRVQSQSLDNYELVDNFKIKGLTTKVYFKDPFKVLIKTYPDFDNKDNKTKFELLTTYLHENTLYIFQTSRKQEVLKNYQLKGNPKKVKTRYYFNLEVINHDGTIDKIVDNKNIGGSFFEHMSIFQNTQGKELVGKGVQIWGYFSEIEPYKDIKDNISNVIKMDIENTIPEDLIYKEESIIKPLFDYQSCGLNSVKKRIITTDVLEYDSLGQISRSFPRKETDTELYLSSRSKEIGGVTTFPYFSSTDKKEIKDNKLYITSTLENINYYLKDISVTTFPNTEQVEKIEGKLIIHGFTTSGETTNYELYIAEFAKVGDCFLPKTVKFCSIEDVNYLQPIIKIEIEYELK